MIVAEDSGLIRELLVQDFERRGVNVIASIGTTRELVRLVDADPPDIVVLDIKMPVDEGQKVDDTAGLAAAKEIRKRHKVALLVLSHYPNQVWAQELFALGIGIGYLLKDRVQKPVRLFDHVKTVAAGGTLFDETLADSLWHRKRVNDPLHELTDRQREVLLLMTKGYSNAQIEKELGLAKGTIQGHERAIYAKLGLSNLPEDEQVRINRRVTAALIFLSSTNPTVDLGDLSR
jgi:DNA-binding NarL/FixJ family response regulator